MTPGIEFWYGQDESRIRGQQRQAADQAQAVAETIAGQRRDWGLRPVPPRAFQHQVNHMAKYIKATVEFMEGVNLDAVAFDGVIRQAIAQAQSEYEAELNRLQADRDGS